jgi:very-short-patch-repair endonuclease
MHRPRATDPGSPRQHHNGVPRRSRDASVESVLQGLTHRQHGVVTRTQLAEAGLSRARTDNLLRSGRLVRLHPGVYRCSLCESTPWTRASAAALSATAAHGSPHESDRVTVAVSHRMAAVLRSYLSSDVAAGRPVDVTGRPVRRTRGVRVHLRLLGAGDAELLKGVPVTSPARTILDLAGDVTQRDLEQTLAAAEKRLRHIRRDLAEHLVACPRYPGSGVLRRLLAALAATGTAPLYLRSRAEEVAWELILTLGLPKPLANHRVLGIEVDFHWPELRLVLEVDGFEFHGDLEAFHRDRERDRALALAGYQVLRFTWRQLDEEKVRTAAALSAAIARREETLRR